MDDYKKISFSRGTKYLRFVWNFFFKPISEKDYFVEPWKKEEQADCALFRLDKETGLLAEILFFVIDEELVHFLQSTKGQLYLYGAYGQINVCQMRSRGTVTNEEAHLEVDTIRERIRAKILKRREADINKLSVEEVRIRLDILDHGKLFSFHPLDYAYETYERG